MKKEMLDATLATIDALILDEMQTGHCGKYIAVAKLCGHADKLRHMAIARVGDVKNRDVDGIDELVYGDAAREGDYVVQDDGFVGAVGYDLPFRVNPRPPRDNPMGDVLRVFTDYLDKLIPAKKAPLNPLKEPAIRTEWLDLNMMFGICRDLIEAGKPTDIIDRKIDQALDAINANDHTDDKETPDADRTGYAMVHPQLPRGHSPRDDGGEQLQHDHHEGDIVGVVGDRQVRIGRAQEGVAVVTDGSDLDGRRGDHPDRRADQEGECGAGEAAQAQPDDHQRGEVHRRDDGGGAREPRRSPYLDYRFDSEGDRNRDDQA